MAVADITAQRVRELFEYNPETGLLIHRSNRHWRVVAGSSPTGKMRSGYVRVAVDRNMCLVHRIAWLHYYGKSPEFQIDHINGDKSDNRIANLRDVPPVVNNENRRVAQRRSKTGVLGVSPRYGKFVAALQAKGVFMYLGLFDSVEEASAAYVSAKRALHGGCTI